MKSETLGGLVLVLLSAMIGYVLLNKPNATDAPLPKQPDPALKHQLVYVSSKACVWCDKMERSTFKEAKVVERLSERYTFTKVSGKEAARYSAKGYPTYVILLPDGRELRRGTGYRNADEFLAWLEQPARPNAATDQFTPAEIEP